MNIYYYLGYLIITLFFAKAFSFMVSSRMSIPWARLSYMLVVYLPLISPFLAVVFYARFYSLLLGLDISIDYNIFIWGLGVVGLYFGTKNIP